MARLQHRAATHRHAARRLAAVLFGAIALAGCSNVPETAPPAYYRFDDRLPGAVRTDAPVSPGSRGALAFTFDDGQPLDWRAGKPSSTCAIEDGALVLTASEADGVTSPGGLGIDGASVDSVVLRMQVSVAGRYALRWRIRGGDWTEIHRVLEIHVTRPGEMVAYNLEVAGVRAWRHRTIDQIRLATDVPARIAIDEMRFLTRKDVFAHEPIGIREYSVGNRVRPCLFAHCPATITYALTVPQAPRLTMGLARVDTQAPVTFSIEIQSEGETATVFTQTVDSDEDWHDVEADLAAFAGRDVELTLKAECGTPGQVALWSNPVLYESRPPVSRRFMDNTPPDRVNVVVYVIDCLRADHMDAYGYHRKTAPNIRAFGREGIRFARCFSQDTWTKPSMSSLATGVDQFVHGVERYGDMIPDSLVMLPELFRAAGYATGAISENPHTPPDARHRRAYSFLETPHLRGELGDKPLLWKQLPPITHGYAKDFLERHRDRNFFLYIHTMEPHDIPVDEPGEFLVYDPPDAYRHRWSSTNDPAPIDLYDETIAFADDNFQRLLDTIDELGLRDNTLVVVMADHGESFGDHEDKQGHAGKPYNELIHIPLFMRLPGVLPTRRVVEENVALIDVPPTILDIAGLPPCEQFQGMKLTPLVARNNAEAFRNRLIPSTWAGVTSGIRENDKLFDDPHRGVKMLFDLANDFGETRDRAQEAPAVLAQLDRELAAHIEQGTAARDRFRAQAPGTVLTVDPVAQEQLSALGYLGDDDEDERQEKDDGIDSNLAEQLGALGYVGVDDGNVDRDAAADLAGAGPIADAQGNRTDHVILLVIDALRADHLGCYGYHRDTSPFIDSLAEQGLVFEQAMAVSSFTCESVAAMFTGLLPSYSGAGAGWAATPNPDTRNLAELFRRAGYATGLFVNTPALFDPRFDTGFLENDHIERRWGISGQGMTLSRRALEFFKKHRAHKTFTYLHYLDPHGPYEPPEQRYRQFAPDVFPEPLRLYDQVRPYIDELVQSGFGPGDPRFEDLVVRYDAEIAETDAAIAALCEGLRGLGILDNVLLVITADHGEEFLDHGYVEHGWRLYSESIRVPLIFWAPGWFTPGRESAPVSHISMLPTLLGLARIPTGRDDLQGEALFRPGIRPAAFVPPTKPLISELLCETRPITRSVIQDGRKYLASPRWMTPSQCAQAARVQEKQLEQFKQGTLPLIDSWAPPEHEEFYDIEKDPEEQRPLTDLDQPIRAQLRAVLTGLKASSASGTSGGGPQPPRQKHE
ncbi:MAG: sulfatase-like hydrolase/transferase [Nitrospiraceae bacterium]|nr:sulfatase-like hydrolase/transferase [Nitrospiraceae bacterium]